MRKYPEDFDKFWKRYPKTGRVLKSDAYKAFKQHVKRDNYENFLISLKKYQAHLNLPENADWLRAKHCHRWIRNWEDWFELEIEEEVDVWN